MSEDEAARHRASRFAWGPGDVEIVEAASEASTWSAEAKAATRAALDGSALAGMDGHIAFKNHDGRFALLADADLRAGRLHLADRKTGAVSTFDGADALIGAGWVLD